MKKQPEPPWNSPDDRFPEPIKDKGPILVGGGTLEFGERTSEQARGEDGLGAGPRGQPLQQGVLLLLGEGGRGQAVSEHFVGRGKLNEN